MALPYERIKIDPAMKRLGARNFALIADAVRDMGSYDPEEILHLFEEQLYFYQSDTIVLFLKWVSEDKENRGFGSGNYEKRFKEFRETFLK